MHALDVLILVVFLGFIAAGLVRGFARGLLEALGLYCVLIVTGATYPTLAKSAHFAITHSANQAWSFGVCFFGLGTIAVIVAALVHKSIDFNLGMIDKIAGAAAGFGAALVVGHGIALTADLNTPAGSDQTAIAGTGIAHEALTFDAYHAFIDQLSSSTGGSATIASK